jgi:phytoene dehydrogenase-like protein
MEKKIVIIGAGIAGLSAGCYARMNGYQAEIYESHNQPGGLCTAWNRGDYTIDGCLHWLTGSAPADSFYKFWEELGAVQNRQFHNHEAFYHFKGYDGRTFIIYCDADRLEKHMKELSPEDAAQIELLCRLIRKFAKFIPPNEKALELYGFLDYVKLFRNLAPFMKDYNFCKNTSINQFAMRFKDPFLREVIPLILHDGEMSMVSLVFTLSLLHKKAGGFPIGGSLEFAKSIETRLLDLGGHIHYKKRVEKILVKDGIACGIMLDDGTEVIADYVISGADLRTTIYRFLDGKYSQPQHEELFKKENLFPSSVQVSYGVNMDLSKEADCVSILFKLYKPLVIGNEKTEWLSVRNFSFDQTLAPKGKTVVETFIFIKDFKFWEDLYKDRAAYKTQKEKIGNLIADEIEKKYPGFKSKIEMTDVATPMTYVRYTGVHKGTYMTWIMTPALMKKHPLIKKTLPGLKNFWHAGMWVLPPGGVPTGAKTARDVMQMICRQDGKKFVTSVVSR